MMKGSEIVGFGSFNIPKNFDKIIADNKDLAECTSRIDCKIIPLINRYGSPAVVQVLSRYILQSIKEHHCV